MRIPPLILPLTRDLLDLAVADMRDSRMQALAGCEAFAALALAPGGFARALVGPGAVLAAAGVIPHWAGRGEAWMIVTRAARARDIVFAIRAARAGLGALQKSDLWRRIEIYIRADAPWRLSFAEALEFRMDATLRAWGPDGGDFCLFSRIGGAG